LLCKSIYKGALNTHVLYNNINVLIENIRSHLKTGPIGESLDSISPIKVSSLVSLLLGTTSILFILNKKLQVE